MRFSSVLIVTIGAALAGWVVYGRGLFGLLGSLAGMYVLLLGLPIVLLHVLIARRMARTVRLGFSIRPRTKIVLSGAWVLLLVLGITIPDRIDGSLHSVLTGDTPGLVGLAIGISNPLGIISIGLLVATILCATFDARDPNYSEDVLVEQALQTDVD